MQNRPSLERKSAHNHAIITSISVCQHWITSMIVALSFFCTYPELPLHRKSMHTSALVTLPVELKLWLVITPKGCKVSSKIPG